MKKLVLAGLMLTGTAAFAQKIDAAKVPAAVKAAFDKNYSGVTGVKWEMEKDNYEVNFSKGNAKQSVLITKSGNILETETAIKTSDLPAAVTAYVTKNYKNEKIKEAAMIRKADGAINYEAEVKGMDLIFDKEG